MVSALPQRIAIDLPTVGRSRLTVKSRVRGVLVLGAILIHLCTGASARCERPRLPAPLQAKVNQAIDGGIVFLVTTQGPWGTWTEDRKNHPVAYAALPGLTLLECGERNDHPTILLAASFVRQYGPKLENTYDLSLAILFLDRLADPADEKLIQMLALRLIAGQSYSGGWSYRCPALNAQQTQQLLTTLRSSSKTFPLSAATLKNLPVFHSSSGAVLGELRDKPHDIHGTTDNSNSQFATLALWAARRHGIPMERTLTSIARRFITSQNRDGSWGYHYFSGGGDPERPAMTCVGLLGLAIGHGLAAEKEANEDPAVALDRTQSAAVVAFHPPLSFLFLALERAEKKQALDRAKRRGKDEQILYGFAALDKHVGAPVDRTEGIPQRDLYFMWSLERVGVLYDLETIGRKDWYRWGAEMLVANQTMNGNWENGGYPSANFVIDTCLALLFLKRANLVADLTTKLPFDPNALNSSINEQLAPTARGVPLSSANLTTINMLKTVETPPAPTPEPPSDLAKSASGPGAASPPPADSSALSEDAETRGRSGWLWLLVVLAVVLFVACGVLLTSYSLAQTKTRERPRWKRHAKGRQEVPHRSAKRSKRAQS